MFTRSKKRKHNQIGQTCKTIAGSLALMTWLLMFVAVSLKANAGTFQLAKTVISSKTTPVDFPTNSSDPLPLPEDPESYIAELEDEAGDDKKICFTTYFIQLITVKQTAQLQTVQTFQYKQAIQQRIAIPLFVLHHSWKSYLS